MSELGSVGIVERKQFTFADAADPMSLDCGASLGPITLAYETYGALNADSSNAILLTHALSGDAHVAGRHAEEDKKPGWWDTMVGPGKAFDTNRFFIICSNVLGGCQGSTGPSSIDPTMGKPFGLTFPIITIADMVRAQRELIRHLGIEKLLCVAGGSMGGMQTLEWVTLYPTMMQSAMVIASTHRSGAQQIAFDAVGRNAIQADPQFKNGQYHDAEAPANGLAIARMLAHITYLSEEGMHGKFGRTLQDKDQLEYGFNNEFTVESYLNYQGAQFVNRFDANTYMYVTKALDYFDISERYGSLDAAMEQVQCNVLVLSYSSDWLYPPAHSKQIVDALASQQKDVTYCNIESSYGHDGFLLEVETMDAIVSGFLKHNNDAKDTRNEAIDALPEKQRTSTNYIVQGEERRIDYELILDHIKPNSRVLDIGCGAGDLLCHLSAEKNVQGVGLELNEQHVIQSIQNGVSVIQANIDYGLSALPDQCFDYITFTRTLQMVEQPHEVLNEMLRVGKKCIVTFPNFGYWKARSIMFFTGKSPTTKNLPFKWYESPNRHYFSIYDFRALCEQQGIKIEAEIPLNSNGQVRIMPNARAEDAIYIITSK
jgi:homoserine O-acetyltransferase/O-succinyltransferase